MYGGESIPIERAVNEMMAKNFMCAICERLPLDPVISQKVSTSKVGIFKKYKVSVLK